MTAYRIEVVARTIEADSELQAVEEFMRWLDTTNEDDLVLRVESPAGPRFWLGSVPGGPAAPVQQAFASVAVDVRLPSRLIGHVTRSASYTDWLATKRGLPMDLHLFRLLHAATPGPDGAVTLRVDRALKPGLTWWARDLEADTSGPEVGRRANVRSARAVLRALEKVK